MKGASRASSKRATTSGAVLRRRVGLFDKVSDVEVRAASPGDRPASGQAHKSCRIDHKQHAMEDQYGHQSPYPAVGDKGDVAEERDEPESKHALHAKRQKDAGARRVSKPVEGS